MKEKEKKQKEWVKWKEKKKGGGGVKRVWWGVKDRVKKEKKWGVGE